MVRRWLLAGIAVSLGLLGCVWYSTAQFTIADTVTAKGAGPGGTDISRKVLVTCERGSATYSTNYLDTGTGTVVVLPSDDLPNPLLACDASLTDRRVVSMAFIVAGLALAGVAVTSGRDEDPTAA